MPTIFSPSMIRSAPMFFSAISFRASNIDAVGAMACTVGSDLDRRIWATSFIGASRDKARPALAREPLYYVASSVMFIAHHLYWAFHSAEHILLATIHTL